MNVFKSKPVPLLWRDRAPLIANGYTVIAHTPGRDHPDAPYAVYRPRPSDGREDDFISVLPAAVPNSEVSFAKAAESWLTVFSFECGRGRPYRAPASAVFDVLQSRFHWNDDAPVKNAPVRRHPSSDGFLIPFKLTLNPGRYGEDAPHGEMTSPRHIPPGSEKLDWSDRSAMLVRWSSHAACLQVSGYPASDGEKREFEWSQSLVDVPINTLPEMSVAEARSLIQELGDILRKSCRT